MVEGSVLGNEVEERLAARGVDLDAVARTVLAIEACFRAGGKLLLFGNGGSAADAQHMATELVGRFALERAALPAIALTTDTSALTAIANDFGFERVFARQVEALGRPGDVAVGISTSGASANVVEGVRAARRLGLVTVGLSGRAPCPLADAVDVSIAVPGEDAAGVQETHLAVEHAVCGAVETLLFAAPAAAGFGPPSLGRVVSLEELIALREGWRRAGMTVVWTNGVFDVLHIGHLRSLQAARALGDVLVVGVNGDDSVRKLRGADRPVFPAAERGDLLASLRPVDYVVVFEAETPEAVLGEVRPDVHCKGEDYAPPHGKPIPEREVVESYGGRVEFLPLVESRSTTQALARIRKGGER